MFNLEDGRVASAVFIFEDLRRKSSKINTYLDAPEDGCHGFF